MLSRAACRRLDQGVGATPLLGLVCRGTGGPMGQSADDGGENRRRQPYPAAGQGPSLNLGDRLPRTSVGLAPLQRRFVRQGDAVVVANYRERSG